MSVTTSVESTVLGISTNASDLRMKKRVVE